MELRTYLKIFKREQKLIFSVMLVTMLTGTLFTLISPPRFETSLSLFIGKTGTQETTDFKYDGYYALQAESLAAESIAKRLQAPGVVEEIYKQAELDPKATKIKNFKKKFTATKMMGSYVEVAFITESETDAAKLTAALVDSTAAFTDSLKQASSGEVALGVSHSAPVTRPAGPGLSLVLAATLVCGLGLGLWWALLKHYFKKP